MMNTRTQDPTLLYHSTARRLYKLAAEPLPGIPMQEASRMAWGMGGTTPLSTFSYGLGRYGRENIAPFLRHRYWGDDAPWKGALQFGTAGAAGAAGLGFLYNQVAPYLGMSRFSVPALSGLAGLATSALGAFRAHNLQKYGPQHQ